MTDFLLAFQRICIKLKPHKFYLHRCSERKLLSKLDNNVALRSGVVALFADYSENLKKLSSRTGSALQYRERPDFSLLNVPCFVQSGGKVNRLDYHCISDDPKHDTSLWPASLRQITSDILEKYPNTKHFDITTDTSKIEFKSVGVFKRVLDNIVIPLNKSVSLCNFGPQHGKFLYDGIGHA